MKIVYKETLLPSLYHLKPPWSWYYLYSGKKKAKARGTGYFPCCTALRWQDKSLSLTAQMSHSGRTLWSVLPPMGDVWIPENHLWPSSGRCGIAMLAVANSFQCWWAPRKQSKNLLHQGSQWFRRLGFLREGLASLGWLSVGLFPTN